MLRNTRLLLAPVALILWALYSWYRVSFTPAGQPEAMLYTVAWLSLDLLLLWMNVRQRPAWFFGWLGDRRWAIAAITAVLLGVNLFVLETEAIRILTVSVMAMAWLPLDRQRQRPHERVPSAA